MQDFKTCTKCNLKKPIDEFTFRKDRQYYNMQCKACISEKAVKWKKDNKQKARETARLYTRKNRNKVRKWARNAVTKPLGRSSRLFNSAKLRASQKNLEFSITVDHIHVVLMIGICQKTGFKFDLTKRKGSHRNPYAPSVDRIDNKKGYTPENIQIVCNMYNTGKGEATEDEFLKMCIAVVKNSGKCQC